MRESLSRRQLLGRGAVIGAIVWTAPVLTTVPALAQGSIEPEGLQNPSFEDGPPGASIPGWTVS